MASGRIRKGVFSMCGICGFLEKEAESDSQTLERMNARLIHRGPDDEGSYRNGPIGLAMRRLSIIDVATGHQPLHSCSGDSWIVYNGETYNFAELRRSLETIGVTFRTDSDTEVVINLYEREGLGFVNQLRGMFALAIWDSPRKRLVLARDPLGKKPLYYCLKENGNLVFASEIKAILPYPGIRRDLDEEALDLYLTLDYVPAPFSIFRSIRKLPPGHMLICEAGRPPRITRYWDVPAREQRRPLPELREEFLALLDEAVRLRMVSDVPLGAFLSGGLDSSAVVAMMAKHSREPVRTFSVGFSDKSYNELPYARKVSQRFNTTHQEQVLEPDINELIMQLADSLDEPLGDVSIYPTYLVSRAARQHVTVALSGDGGDEIFGGYEHYLAQKAARLVDIPPARPLLRHFPQVSALIPPNSLKKGMVNRIRRFSEGFAHDTANRHIRWMIHLSRAMKQELYSRDFCQDRFLSELYDRPPFTGHFASSRLFSGLNQDFYLDLKTYLSDDIMAKVDRMSMTASLETRAPLLDVKLVEFAFTLPADLKVHGRTGKWFFKKAMEGILPRDIIYRRKEGFSFPMKTWLRGELKDLMRDYLSERRLRALGLFNPNTVRQWMWEHLEEKQDHSHRLWPLILFHLWHERHVHA
jgi:asparagine synthase (glutamine-hydrolysing)